MMLELDCAKIMLRDLVDHPLVGPNIGDQRIRFDFLYDNTYDLLSTGEQALVDLAQMFFNGYAPTRMSFGAALRALDADGVGNLAFALKQWRDQQWPQT